MQTNVPFTASICRKISLATARSSFTRGTQSQPFLINAFLCTTMTFFQVFIGLSIHLLFYIQTNCFCTPPLFCLVGTTSMYNRLQCLLSDFMESLGNLWFSLHPSLWNWHTEFIFQSQGKRRIFTGSIHPSEKTFCYCRVMEMVKACLTALDPFMWCVRIHYLLIEKAETEPAAWSDKRRSV